MTRFEKWAVNTRVRVWAQRLFPTPFFLRHSRIGANPVCLEIGCGQGAGTQIILYKWRAELVAGLDLDRKQIDLAKNYPPANAFGNKVKSKYKPQIKLLVGDMAALPFAKAQFDAVFDYAAIHHTADWRLVLAEIYRTLKPGGQIFFEDILKPILNNRLFSCLFPHPEGGKFSRSEFTERLQSVGFMDIITKVWGRSYLLGTAQKPVN